MDRRAVYGHGVPFGHEQGRIPGLLSGRFVQLAEYPLCPRLVNVRLKEILRQGIAQINAVFRVVMGDLHHLKGILYAKGIAEAVAGIHIADLPDGLPGNGGVVNGGLRGDLAADDAEICGDHGLTGHAGMGVLGKAGVQNGVGDGVRYFVRVSVGDTFRGKKSFFHFVFPFCLSKLKKKNRTPKIRCALLSNPHLSFAAGFGTLYKQVAGFHRAVPSTTLDKACMQFNTVFYTIF